MSNQPVMFDERTAERVLSAVRVIERNGGVFGQLGASANPRGDGGVIAPGGSWQIFQWTPASPPDATPPTYWRNVRVHLGHVNNQTTTAAVFCHELDPMLPTGSPAASDYDILVPENTNEYKIWGEASFTRSAWTSSLEPTVTISDVRIAHGADWWTGYPAAFPEDGEFRFAIGTVTTGDDEDDPHVISIDQIATGDITLITPPILFVTLEQDGGDAGDKDTACTYTYTATDLGGTVLATGLTPLNSRARILNAPTIAATRGTVYWNSDGVIVLWDADEKLEQYSCEE